MPSSLHHPAPRPAAGAVPFVLRGRGWALTRHLIAAVGATLCLMAVWTVLSAPFALVLIIDYTGESYSEFAAWSAVVIAGTTLAVVPMAAGAERLVLRGGWGGIIGAVALVPGALLAAITGYVGLMAFVDSAPVREISMLGVLAMLDLAVYWLVLWALHVSGYLLRRHRSARRTRRS